MDQYHPSLIDTMRESCFWRTLFAVLIIFGLCLPSVMQPARAFALADIAQGKVYLENRDSDPFFMFRVDGDQVAYCGQPRKAAPADGWYTKHAVNCSNPDRNRELCAALYFGYGGPGYQYAKDHGIFPETQWDGQPMTEKERQLITRTVVVDAYWADGDFATSITSMGSAEKQKWYQDNVLT